VMLIMRPWTGAFHPALLLSVGNAFMYASFNILTRRLAATESPASLQLMSAIGAAVVIAPFGLAQWKDPADALTWAVIGLAGLCGGLGHYFVAQAHRYATAATLGPFLYQQILYMTLLGWLVFAQVPDALVIAGAAVVVASGLYLLWVEVKGR
jgi:drug/metabolite transporter (DMT)-like permease